MKYENPNSAAFFFEDGDFLNLDAVAAVRWKEGEHQYAGDDEPCDGPHMWITLKGTGEDIILTGDYARRHEYQSLLDALRIYHSKF